MDYEKKYKESMAKMSTFLAKHDGFTISKDGEMYKELSEIFSELKESKDERIRKAIGYAIGQSTHSDGTLINGVYSEEAVAWLEKQGEQKSNNISPIFRVGDYIRNKKTGDKVLIEQLDIATKAYCHVSYDGAAVNHSDFPFSKQDEWELIGQKVVEQDHTDKVEPKFHEGDWITIKE